MVYLDASALIKRYVVETGSDLVDHIVSRHRPIGTTRLSYVEVHVALARKRREKLLATADYANATRQFEIDFEAFGRIEPRAEILTLAKELSTRNPLRTLDAVHLGSALNFRKRLGVPIVFVAADRRLLGIARKEGLHVLNVESPGEDDRLDFLR